MNVRNDTEELLAQECLLVPHGRPEELFAMTPLAMDGPRAVAQMTVGQWANGTDGRPMSGATAVLLDDVLSQAALAERAFGSWGVTAELSLDFMARPVAGGILTAEATTIHTDAGGGMARGELIDELGNTVAVGTTWSRFIPTIPDSIFEQIEAQPLKPGDRPRKLSELLGVQLDVDCDSLKLPLTPNLTNPLGMFHGGVQACAFDYAVHALAKPEPGLRTASLKIAYLRPGISDLKIAVSVLHRGRSLLVAEVTSVRDDGKVSARGTVTLRSEVQ
jgi:uncharacterized protein (TIGR00369 family)